MKPLMTLLVLLFLGSVTITSAQEYRTEVDLIQSTLGKAKKDFMMQLIEIPGNKADKFWKYYNEYEVKRKMYAEKRVMLINKYVSAYSQGNYDKATIRSTMREATKLNNRADKNIHKYYEKIFHHVSPQTAIQFAVIENYIRNTVDGQIYERLPVRK